MLAVQMRTLFTNEGWALISWRVGGVWAQYGGVVCILDLTVAGNVKSI